MVAEQWEFIQTTGVALVAMVAALLVYVLGGESRW